MEKRPMELAALEQQHQHLVIASYTADIDPALDKIAADAALNLKILVTDTEWAAKNGGIRETSGTGGIASIGAGPPILLTMADLWEAAGPTKRIIPIVRFKGEAIPFVGTGGVNGITTWDGLTAAKTITIDNTGGKYSTTITDYEVTLLGDLPGFLQALNAGGVSLPYTLTKNKSLGYRDPTFTKIVNDGEEATGDFTFYEVVNAIKQGAGIFNKPGEDVEAALFGSDWTAGAQNRMTYQTNPFALSILQFTGNKLHDATKAGAVFAIEQRLYAGRVSNIPNPQNKAGDATNPILKQFDFTVVNGVYRKVHLVSA